MGKSHPRAPRVRNSDPSDEISLSYMDTHDELLQSSTQLTLFRETAVKCLHLHHHSVHYILFSSLGLESGSSVG